MQPMQPLCGEIGQNQAEKGGQHWHYIRAHNKERNDTPDSQSQWVVLYVYHKCSENQYKHEDRDTAFKSDDHIS